MSELTKVVATLRAALTVPWGGGDNAITRVDEVDARVRLAIEELEALMPGEDQTEDQG